MKENTTSDTDWLRLKSVALWDGADLPERLWPEGASDEYVAARRALAEAELALRDQVEDVARLRRKLPRGAALGEYAFAEGPRDLTQDEPVRATRLRELFGEHDELVVYHLMFHPDDDAACAMCSLFVDGLHGVSHHIARRAGLAVIGKAPLQKLRRFARRRGWDGLRIVSSHDSTFNADLAVEAPNGAQLPAVSSFVREGEEVRHVQTRPADFADGSVRGMDLISPVWNVFDLLASGRGQWLPDNSYPGRTRG
jgi:predicted dithiol-disulfide oxidoreductase (DUF899 family)